MEIQVVAAFRISANLQKTWDPCVCPDRSYLQPGPCRRDRTHTLESNALKLISSLLLLHFSRACCCMFVERLLHISKAEISSCVATALSLSSVTLHLSAGSSVQVFTCTWHRHVSPDWYTLHKPAQWRTRVLIIDGTLVPKWLLFVPESISVCVWLTHLHVFRREAFKGSQGVVLVPLLWRPLLLLLRLRWSFIL